MTIGPSGYSLGLHCLPRSLTSPHRGWAWFLPRGFLGSRGTESGPLRLQVTPLLCIQGPWTMMGPTSHGYSGPPTSGPVPLCPVLPHCRAGAGNCCQGIGRAVGTEGLGSVLDHVKFRCDVSRCWLLFSRT